MDLIKLPLALGVEVVQKLRAKGIEPRENKLGILSLEFTQEELDEITELTIENPTPDCLSGLEHFRNLKSIGQHDVTNIDLKDGAKLMLGEKSKILVRPSGTEPLLRIYFESDSEEKLENLKQEVEKIL